MTTLRMVVTDIESEPKNVDGGRTITVVGELVPNKDIAHVVLTFGTTEALQRLRAAIDTA